MVEQLFFCDPDSLKVDYLTEFLAERRVPQNLFYLLNGANAFYAYRNADLAQIAWQEEYDFFVKQPFWLQAEQVAFVSLGCGNAGPEKMLLSKLHAGGYPVHYVGVDSSEQMLALATENLDGEAVPQTYALGDFSRPDFSARLWDVVVDFDVRVYAMLGGTFGNFDQVMIAELLALLIPTGDYLYLDVVPQYATAHENQQLRARLSRAPENLSSFFDGLLATLGLSRENGDIVAVESRDGVLNTFRYTFYLEVAETLTVSCMEEEATLQAGERVELLSIRAYDVASLTAFLAGYGFRLLDTYIPDVGNLGHRWQRLMFVKSARPET